MKKKMYISFKKIADRLFSIILLILCLPIFILIAVAIRIDSTGNVFFKQERIGLDEQPFLIYKFRTMIIDAESKGDGVFVFSNQDVRVTKVGKILRKTSLDELPQLINIVLGEMSFIGPRPPVTYHPYRIGEYPSSFKKRFSVLPGITGLAQVTLRNSEKWDNRIILDIEYVQSMSLWLDMKIIVKTFLSVLKSKNVIISESHKSDLEGKFDE